MTRLLIAALCVGLAVPAVADDPDKPKGPPAADLLADAQAAAKKDGKRVFLAFGSPTCGWCKYLDKFHAKPAVKEVLEKHLVFVKVDVVENPGGQELYKKYTPDGNGGVPVWAVLDADGTAVADSFADGKTNVGFPYEPDELAHYANAMRKAVPKLTDADMDVVMKELKASGPERKKADK